MDALNAYTCLEKNTSYMIDVRPTKSLQLRAAVLEFACVRGGAGRVCSRVICSRGICGEISGPKKDREVLLQLMRAFKLVRPLIDSSTFVVPAMLPRCEMPSEYVLPNRRNPSQASAVAVINVAGTAQRAEERVVY